MADRMERPTPREAAAALDSITGMRQVALGRGLHSRRFAVAGALWVGALAVATAHDGPAASGAIAVLAVSGTLGLSRWRRRSVARVRNVHGAAGIVTAVVVMGVVLAIGILGARAFEASGRPWAPFASGGAVAVVLFLALELLRRTTRARLMALDR